MDDYSRNVNIDSRRIAPLNGDTVVFPGLEARWAYYHKRPWNDEFYYFNIIEDFCIDDHDHKASQKTPDDYFPLLYSPLPADLPLVNKDKLFCVAAYTGDIDRFVRLKRPETLPHERLIVVHGIYYNIFFAKWWSTRVPENLTSYKDIWTRRAINARRIMSNDLSWLTTDTPDKLLPENIWYPLFAQSCTYQKLAHLEPRMFTRCFRACIAVGYEDMWDQLLLDPPQGVKSFSHPSDPKDRENLKSWRISKITTPGLWEEAKSVRQKKFLQDICAAEPGILDNPPHDPDGYWASYFTAQGLHRSNSPDTYIHDPVQPSSGAGPYDGAVGEIGDIGLAIFTRDIVEVEAWEREQKKRGSAGSFLSMHEIWDILDTVRSG